MPTLSGDRISTLLQPFVPKEALSDKLVAQLGSYLDLLMRWNGRTNLTAIRDPEEIVTRHFGESLFTAGKLQTLLAEGDSVLDFGSGAGFPGLPVQLLLPALNVTLAESQGKKAAFLREAVRVLALPTSLWARRVEDLPAERTFDAVTLRAVDNMEAAASEARKRVAGGGVLVFLGGEALTREFAGAEVTPLPESAHRYVIIVR